MTINDMKHASVDAVPGPYNTPRYFQTIKGWSGAGFESSYRTIDGCFLAAAGYATIQFQVSDTKNGRTYTKHGSIVLTEGQAIELAISILPPELKDVVIEAQKKLAKGG